jgi:hypothetical protein
MRKKGIISRLAPVSHNHYIVGSLSLLTSASGPPVLSMWVDCDHRHGRHLMNLEFMDRIGPRTRLAVTSCAVILCVAATFVLGYILEEAVIYTHFYYIPVVLAALWYQRRGLIVPFILVGVYLLSLGASPRGLETDDYLKARSWSSSGSSWGSSATCVPPPAGRYLDTGTCWRTSCSGGPRS